MEIETRWRLILGQNADPDNQISLDGAGETGMDNVMEALYDSNRKGSLGSSSPNVNRWLGDIRKFFPSSVVQVMQKDALERLGLQQMLLEPELLQAVEPDIHLVGALLSLNKILPQKSRETARMVVAKIVQDIEKRLKTRLQSVVRAALNKQTKQYRPKHREINWNKTIQLNLKHYQAAYKTIIPERLVGYGRKSQSLKEVILLIDQSGSMAESVVYAGVLGAALASVTAVKTHIVVFDTAVIDLTEHCHDPVELLFGTQLGGGTDIAKAITYADTLIQNPLDTVLILISDLYEGGNQADLLQKTAYIKQKGVNMITLLALSDHGTPSYDHQVAAKFSAMDIPVFGCTPDLFPELIALAIQRKSLDGLQH